MKDIEIDNLKRNLVFFSIEEKALEGPTENENGDENQAKETENCMETILDFCETNLKVENAKTTIQIEKAYRLGKLQIGAPKPRPIVVTFSKLSDREMIRSISSRLKNSKFGISPQYPKEVLDRRKKLIPIMFKERKNKKSAYLVGDKLYVEGELWKN